MQPRIKSLDSFEHFEYIQRSERMSPSQHPNNFRAQNPLVFVCILEYPDEGILPPIMWRWCPGYNKAQPNTPHTHSHQIHVHRHMIITITMIVIYKSSSSTPLISSYSWIQYHHRPSISNKQACHQKRNANMKGFWDVDIFLWNLVDLKHLVRFDTAILRGGCSLFKGTNLNPFKHSRDGFKIYCPIY